MKGLSIALLSVVLVIGGITTCEAQATTVDACKGSPPPSKFIIVKESSSATSIAKANDEYLVTLNAPKMTFLTDDPCTKQKLATWSSTDFKQISKILSSYDRYAIMVGDKHQMLVAKVKGINVNDNEVTLDVNKMYGEGNFTGKIEHFKVFLMEVQYKDLLVFFP